VIRPELAKAFLGFAKADRAMWTGDKMRLLDRDQRVQEAFQKSMQPELKPEEDVNLSVDSPTNVAHHYPAPVVIKSNPWPWIAAILGAMMLMIFSLAVLGLGTWLYLSRPHATPAKTTTPAAATSENYGIELFTP
jgi:hypothetical protein